MTHDPLCSVQDDDPLLLQLLCICGELSAARRETMAKAIAAVEGALIPAEDPRSSWNQPIGVALEYLAELQTP